MNERHKGVALNIGNLICLEKDINSLIDKDIDNYIDKKKFYKKSKYKWILSFVKNTKEFHEKDIDDRARRLANDFYDKAQKILKYRFK